MELNATIWNLFYSHFINIVVLKGLEVKKILDKYTSDTGESSLNTIEKIGIPKVTFYRLCKRSDEIEKHYLDKIFKILPIPISSNSQITNNLSGDYKLLKHENDALKKENAQLLEIIKEKTETISDLRHIINTYKNHKIK